MGTDNRGGVINCDKRCERDQDAQEEYDCVRCPGKMAPDPDLTISKTILAQLGGRRFIAMTGARDFIGGTDYLMFRLPRGLAKNGINKVKITLDWTDTYIVEAMRLGPVACEILEKVDFVYADALQSVFTSLTGLDTHL